MTTIEASDVIAGGALLVSLFTLASGRRSQGRAHFTAEWRGRESIIVRNHGPGLANDVTITLPLTGQDPSERVTEAPSAVAALQSVRLDFYRLFGGEIGPLEISWRDNRFRRQTRTIYMGQGPHSPSPRPRLGSPLEERVAEIVRSEIEADNRWRRAQGGG